LSGGMKWLHTEAMEQPRIFMTISDGHPQAYYDTSVSGLLISLDIDSLSCMPSSRQIKDALMDLTAMVSALCR